MGSLNCRGLKGEDADAQKSSLVLAMKRFKIDILLLQETHINTNSYEKINGHTFIYSTSVTDEQRKTAETRRAQAGMHKGRGKGKMLMLDVAIVNKLKILNMVVLAVFFHHFSWQR